MVHCARLSSSGVSPFELMYARKPVLPLHLLSENESDIPEYTPVNLDMEEGVPDSDAVNEHLKFIQEVQNVIADKAMQRILNAQSQ